MRTRPTVLLATLDLKPDGEPGGHLLVEALAAEGVRAEWAAWSDPRVDWAAADLATIRSTWDYHRRLPEFLAWVRRVELEGRLLGRADVVAWNADKAYLVDLAEHLPVVPTLLAGAATLSGVLARALARWGEVVLKSVRGPGAPAWSSPPAPTTRACRP